MGATSAPTIYDVAAAAGVSISTVSLCLNQPGRVAASTRSRVLAAADALGYVPKAEAASRARKATGRVGVIAPFTSYASFGRRLNGVIRELAGENIEVVVFDHESAVVSPLLSTLPLTGRVDGLIVMSIPIDQVVATRLRELGVPVVLLDIAQEGFDAVITDDAAGARLAAEHLIGRGHSRIGFLGEGWEVPHAHQSQCELRLAGLRAALESAGLSLEDRHVGFASHRIESARSVALEVLGGADPPSAVLAHDDLLAAGVLHAAHQLGVSVPSELAVVGFDDSEVAAVLGLTTVRQPFEESGALAARALLQRIASPSLPARTTVLELTLVERDTT